MAGGARAPMVMTPAFLQASRDSFPLELIEMQQQRLVLLGEDFFAGVTFDPPHVVHRTRAEIALGRHATSRGGRWRQGSFDSAGGVAGAFRPGARMRGMLWLKGRTEALPATTILAEIENLAGRHLPGVRRA